MFRDGKSAGITFSLQLKSTESPGYSADGSFVSVRLEAPNARHLAIDMQHPVLLVSGRECQTYVLGNTTDRC